MREIYLTQKSKKDNQIHTYTVFVDDADYDELMKIHWYVWKKSTANTMYARAYFKIGKIKKMKYMHQFLMESQGKFKVDHKDRNGLNNQRSNLREATGQENIMNVQPQNRKNKTSKYKGVNLHRNRWRARIRVNGKLICLGEYKSEIRAGWEYDEGVAKYFKEFGYLNFI